MALETQHAVNDMKKFTVDGKDWYVAAFHQKGDAAPTQEDVDKTLVQSVERWQDLRQGAFMVKAREEMDRNIFAVGYVADKDRMLGVLYGAGPSNRSNRNQIFGHWLQKRILLTADRAGRGAEYEAQGALGPDRQLVKLPPLFLQMTLLRSRWLSREPLRYSPRTVSLLSATQPVSLRPGGVYRLEWKTGFNLVSGGGP